MIKKTSKIKKIAFAVLFILTAITGILLLLFLAWTRYVVNTSVADPTPAPELTEDNLDFPVGVNLVTKKIKEDPELDWYVSEHLSINVNSTKRLQFLDKLLVKISKLNWYQNLASSVSRILVIYSGERKEEIADSFAKILNWNKDETSLFINYISEAEPVLSDGKFFPGRYVVPLDATPELVADLVYSQFNTEVLQRYSPEVEAEVPFSDALIVASLLEREAYDFTDMRIISGIIWNRLFIDMPLQLDASLQYARGSKNSEKLWWPIPLPRDKFIDSPFNTYKNKGLPPSPISNPSLEAVIAALNPRSTDCMFYFHGPKGTFYCAKTYDEHVKKLKEVYGRGI